MIKKQVECDNPVHGKCPPSTKEPVEEKWLIVRPADRGGPDGPARLTVEAFTDKSDWEACGACHVCSTSCLSSFLDDELWVKELPEARVPGHPTEPFVYPDVPVAPVVNAKDDDSIPFWEVLL